MVLSLKLKKIHPKSDGNLWTKNGAEVIFIWGNLNIKRDGFLVQI